MLGYTVKLDKNNLELSNIYSKEARITVDTGINNSDDMFNPAELFLSSIAACIAKNISRISGLLNFSYDYLEIYVNGERQDIPPKMININYEIHIKTNEPESKIELLHKNIMKFGTIYNTVAEATNIKGIIKRI